MLAKSRFAQLFVYCLGALFIWAIVGCGGGGGGSTMGGKVSLTIAWPAQDSRYIPTYAHSLSFTLYSLDTEQTPISLVVNRPDQLPLIQTVTFQGPLPSGHYALTGLAKTGFNGNGDTVATATTNCEVAATGTTTVPLTLASTLYSVELLDMPLSMHVGDSQDLRVEVLDQNHNQVFLENGSLSWSIVLGGSHVSVDSQGKVTAKTLGTTRVRVSEIGAGLYSDGDINVVVPSTVTRLMRQLGESRQAK